MNPWLSQQLADARTDDWLRAADRLRRVAEARHRVGVAGSPVPGRPDRPALTAARARVGTLLIRTGERVMGPACAGDPRLA